MRIINFLKSVVEEGKKVEWLNKKDLYKYSKIVVVFIVAVTSFIALLDIAFVSIRTYITESILF